jgi:hypothetical protein
MKEYSTCHTSEQVIFNQMLRSAINKVEHAFGRLKARWQVLTTPINVSLEDTPNLIFACFVLHNYCERHKIQIDNSLVQRQMEIDQEQQPTSFVQSRYSCTTAQGVRTRDVITAYFKEYLL